MNIINKKNNVKMSKITSVLLIMFIFVFGSNFMIRRASANDLGFEIPVCPFEQQEGRTVARFNEKKIFSYQTREDAESEPVAVNLPAGSYKVSLFSYDGYEGRENEFPQFKERWIALLKDGNNVIVQSSPVDDLDDWVASTTQTQVVDEELMIDQDVSEVSALHFAYPDEGPNSVFPVCVAFDLLKLKEEPNHLPIITLVGSTTLNLNVGDIFTDPGATANDEEDGDITEDIIIGGDDIDTGKAGTYTVTYNVNDSQGAAANEVVRTVIIAESSNNGGGGEGSSSSSSSESSSSSSGESNGGGGETGGVGGDTEEGVGTGGGFGRVSFGGTRRIMLPPASSAPAPTIVPEVPHNIGQCSYLNDYLKMGKNNNKEEVLKLQAFLSVIEHLDVPLTGVFDQATFDAVSDFQEKYKEDILVPWGYQSPTGYVYITTKNKINEIFCGEKITLSGEQKTEIENVRNFIKESVNAKESGGSGHDEGIGGDIGSVGEGKNIDGTEESDSLVAEVGLIKSPMAFILDNKVTVVLIGMAIALLVYMFSFRKSKI